MGDEGRELDLDIVTESWRSLTEPEAFDSMIQAWDRKFKVVADQPRVPLLDGILKRQLASIDNLLDSNRIFTAEDPLEKAVAGTPAPAMVFSPDGLVAAHNEQAQDRYGAQQGVRLGDDWVRDDAIADYRAVRNSGPGQSNVQYAIIRTFTLDGSEALAEVYRLDVEGKDSAFTVVRSLEIDWYPKVTYGLEQAFGITKAEADICRLLFLHRDVDNVARARGVALETVRNQVKRILIKTELHSKTELIRMLAVLCARAALEQTESELPWSDPFGTEQLLTRRDGRKLAYSWVGAQSGRPLLYIHGTTSNFYVPQIARDALLEAGIKLICLSMPGHGNSDADAGSDHLADGCDAIEELCEALQVGPIGAVAMYTGQIYLTRLAKMRPDLFSVLLCVGLSWSLTDDRADTLPITQRTIAKLARDAPMAFDVLCRVSHKVIKERGIDFYLSRAFGETEADRKSIADPELLPLLRAGFQHLSAQGHLAFRAVHELSAKNPMSGWLNEVQVPMHWLVPQQVGDVGEADLATLREFSPLISAEIVPETGEMMPYQRSDLFIDRLIELAGESPAETLAAHQTV